MAGYRSTPPPPNWKRLRARVLKRAGGICHVCKQPAADAVDHVIPAFRGYLIQIGHEDVATAECSRVAGGLGHCQQLVESDGDRLRLDGKH